MSEHLIREIDNVKKSIISLGTLVEESLRESVRAFVERDTELAQKVIDGDERIDKAEIEVEEDCLRILALYQPVAIDLRYIVSVLKINNDLERIGDLASNLAQRARSLSTKLPIDVPRSIPRMTEVVQDMLKKSLDALVRADTELAREVLSADDEVDKLHSRLYPIVQEKIESEPAKIAEWIQLLGISRYLERAADHTTNIAEDVIYMVDGGIVRHGGEAGV